MMVVLSSAMPLKVQSTVLLVGALACETTTEVPLPAALLSDTDTAWPPGAAVAWDTASDVASSLRAPVTAACAACSGRGPEEGGREEHTGVLVQFNWRKLLCG